MRMFGDLRDPMTVAEIESDIQQRAEQDRLWREQHPISLKKFGGQITVSEAAMRTPAFQQLRRWTEAVAAAHAEEVERMALLVMGCDPKGRKVTGR